jgi:prevent-host-death family protein
MRAQRFCDLCFGNNDVKVFVEACMVDLVRDLKPVSYFKEHAAQVVKYVGETQNPVVITQNGEAKAVIIDIASYQKTRRAIALAKLIDLSEKSGEKEGYIPHAEVFSKIEKKLKSLKK